MHNIQNQTNNIASKQTVTMSRTKKETGLSENGLSLDFTHVVLVQFIGETRGIFGKTVELALEEFPVLVHSVMTTVTTITQQCLERT